MFGKQKKSFFVIRLLRINSVTNLAKIGQILSKSACASFNICTDCTILNLANFEMIKY